MKKLILASVMLTAICMTASAASIKWSTAALSFGSTQLKNSSDVSGYLLYLPTGSFSDPYTVDTLFTAATVGTVLSTDIDGTSKGGKASGQFIFDIPRDGVGDYKNGDAFAVLVSYTTGGKTYWNLSNEIKAMSGVSEDGDSFVPSDYVFSSVVNEPNTKLTAGGGWTPAVPEPATGALALAGLALLFRRKRA